MKTITTMSEAIDLMDKIEKLTDETGGVTVDLNFKNVPFEEMKILAKQENLVIRNNSEVHYFSFNKGENWFHFTTKII